MDWLKLSRDGSELTLLYCCTDLLYLFYDPDFTDLCAVAASDSEVWGASELGPWARLHCS